MGADVEAAGDPQRESDDNEQDNRGCDSNIACGHGSKVQAQGFAARKFADRHGAVALS